MSQLYSDWNNNKEELSPLGLTFEEIGVVSPDYLDYLRPSHLDRPILRPFVLCVEGIKPIFF